MEVEIGCGNGHFLAEYCIRNPDLCFLGVEIKAKRCQRALQKIERGGLRGARLIQATAEQVLARLPERAVSRFHIYFPDPWPKARHRRRRFLRSENLAELCRALKPGGEIRFATDFFDYYLQVKLLCLLAPELELSGERLEEEVFVSVYGRFFMEKGRRVYSLVARRRL